MQESGDGAVLPVEQLAAWADEMRAMATIGLLYGHDQYDMARYERLRAIADELLARLSGRTAGEVREALAADIGYVTVKVGVAAAVMDESGRLLLVRRRDNGLWAMPGGWADVGDTPARMTEREVWEETGVRAEATRLLGLYDSRQRGFRHMHHLYHVVFLCKPLEGEARVTDETLDVGWFEEGAVPTLSPGHADPVRDAYRAWADPHFPAAFD